MNPPTPPQPDVAFQDPRSESGFQPQHFPRANGKAPPPVDAAKWEERVMIEFLAAYYELNRAYAALLRIRTRPQPSQAASEELECLQLLEGRLVRRDALEDRYAPAGVIAEPVNQEGFTVDVQFRFGSRDPVGRRRFDALTMAAYVPIPWPEEAGFGELPVRFEDPRQG